MKGIALITTITAALMPALPAAAQTAGPPVMDCAPAAAETLLDANNVRAKIMNNGGLFWNGGDSVYRVPMRDGANAIYAAGIWVAGLVNGDLHTSGTTYGPWEFWPGPYENVAAGQDCEDYDRIYRVDRRDIAALARGAEPSLDVQDWPWELGAPVVDGDGNKDNYDLAAGDRPLLLGDETLWWVMNDIGNEHLSTEEPALGLEVQGMAFSSASTENEHLQNATFYRWRIINKSPNVMDSVHFSMFVDADLGNFDDDWVGSDTTLGLGFFYNADNNDEGHFGLDPPAIGFQLLDSPAGMSAMTFFNSGGGVTGDPRNGPDYWRYMHGRWKDDVPMTFGGSGRSYSDIPVRHVFPGDPERREFWSEVNSDSLGRMLTPADRRIVVTSGPFRLEPGDEEVVFMALPMGFGSDHLNSVTVMKDAAAGFVGMRPEEVPSSPTSGVVPGAAPRVLNVGSGATGQPLDLRLRWDRVPVPGEEYEAVLESSGGDTQRWVQFGTEIAPDLEPNTDYVFRVRVASDHAFGPWSEPVAFSTGNERFAATSVFTGFLAVANGAGPLSPPVGAAADFQGFPGSLPRANADQQVGAGQWMIHTFESGSGTFEHFINRSVLGRANGARLLIPYDFEIRFTAGGGKAWNAFTDQSVADVPFELWRIGVATPDDPSDDVRLIPWTIDWDGDGWGITCTDHTVSGGANDPETDAIYWHLPSDTSPGDAGYQAWASEVEATGDGAGPSWEAEIMGRMVLVNRNGGDVTNCSFNQDVPEEGTVLRMLTARPPVPIPSAPAGDAIVEAGPVAFYWSAFRKEGARLEVARDADFRQLLLVLDSAEPGRAQMSATEPGTYWWRVMDAAGGVSAPVRFFVGTAVGTEGEGRGSAVGDGELPQAFALLAPWPNPSMGGVNVPFELPGPAHVTLRVFDALGREVATILDADLLAGRHEAVWEGTTGGVYILRIQAGAFTASRVATVL